MKMTRLIRWGAAVAACCCLMMCAVWDAAAADNATSNTPKIDNVGFMKNPPKELVDRFPMCDAFLNVKWIDKEKLFARSTIDLYFLGETEKGAKNINALVDLGPINPRYDYSTDTYWILRYGISRDRAFVKISKGHEEKFNDLLKQGVKIIKSMPTKIANENDTMELVYLGSNGRFTNGHLHPDHYTLAKNMLTVCIPFPGNKKMWIAEGKKPSQVYSSLGQYNLESSLCGAFQENNSECSIDIDSYTVVDLNFDGRDDYFSGIRMLYSNKDEYLHPSCTWVHNLYEWGFPSHNTSCKANFGRLFFLTTDGKSYFINDQCNLTRAILGD